MFQLSILRVSIINTIKLRKFSKRNDRVRESLLAKTLAGFKPVVITVVEFDNVSSAFIVSFLINREDILLLR